MTEDGVFGIERRRQKTARRNTAPRSAERDDGITVSLVGWILREFDAYYEESRGIPDRAKQAFESRNHGESLRLSRRRLSIYSESIRALAPRIIERYPHLTEVNSDWRVIEDAYLPMIEGRYEADLAYAFLNSVQRTIHQGEWQPVEYAFDQGNRLRSDPDAQIYRDFPGGPSFLLETAIEILSVPDFAWGYRDKDEDAYLIAERINDWLDSTDTGRRSIQSIQVIDAGFYRNRGAYLVGRFVLEGGVLAPLVIALLNDEAGIYVDAVLLSEADSHNIFSSTLANFHVTKPYYHELAAFLHSIMPNRPVGLHYSTIGFNHVGKVAVMNELKAELARKDERFERAVGIPGTVAICFSAPSSAYVLKVIRDRPTAQYKWGEFEGVESVLDKYRRVHEINRTGSMLDNILYYNLRLQREWFDEALCEELLRDAGACVTCLENSLVFKHLIAQPKMIPLPNYLETAVPADAEIVVENLGHCIKNNAAANIFNKDLDGRNYGVSKHLKVYLFDYDALELFTEIKLRTNLDRIDGEEDIPEWFFEDGVIFLPEELASGLRIHDRSLIRRFRSVHRDLLGVDYWQGVQADLLEGRVPSISVYPNECKLLRQVDRLGTYY
jgi:isocitrate dehydrogenase kinase/phosphatase